MGILDDAIREHLELKRQHGAEPDDLARLEKEVFGPATRPGDEPSFDQPESEPEPGIEPGGEDPTRMIAVDEGATGDIEEKGSLEPPSEAGSFSGFLDDLEDDPFGEPGPAFEADQERGEGRAGDAEEARIAHPNLEDTIDHPAVDPGDEPEPLESEIFGAEEEFDLDEINLKLDADSAAPPPAATPLPESEEQPLAEPLERSTPEQPSSTIFDDEDAFGISLDDEREPLAEAPAEPAPAEPEPEPEQLAPEEPSVTEPAPEPEAGSAAVVSEDVDLDVDLELDDGGEEEEDLLEETPEFLESAPEGERLWFEQGEPKDFDF